VTGGTDGEARPPLASLPEKEVGMVGREMTRLHIDDMLRAAERERIAGRVARARGRSVFRRMAVAVASVVLWPVRH
jgi:hypothetical protein